MNILEGKKVLLTGSTGSLGQEIARKLSIAGAKIAVDAIEHMKSQEFTIKSLQTIN